MTIMEILENADYNIQRTHKNPIYFDLGKTQLHNAYTLLDKGYGLYDSVEEIINKYPHIEDAPEKRKD